MPKTYFRAFTLLVKKDITIMARRWQELAALAILSIGTSIPVAYLISGPQALLFETADAFTVIATGQLLEMFIIGILAGFIAVVREAEKHTLDGLRLSAIPSEVVFVAKLVFIEILMLVLSMIYIIVTAALSNTWQIVNINYIVTVVASTVYFSAASALTAFIIIYVESRGLFAAVVLAGFIIPFMQQSGPYLVEAGMGLYTVTGVIGIVGSGVFFSILATYLAKFLSEI